MMFDVNVSAWIAGAVLYMVYGGIYYSILLGKKDQAQGGAVKYVVAVLVAFISSFSVGLLIQMTGGENAAEGALVGGIIGLLIGLVYLKNALFGMITRRMFIVAIGDHLVIFTLLGTLHGLFL
ncbi:DUF1761 domain-containing protein [Bacillus sp. KH172YL63]|uniref:DUF1761 domain-containing protein n=1 Tax=Bacillus sp. KH172YL63 TaxID=2709784 RepID=UPI0013E451BE|nr:DUF1761 domain-containing protein [Bacillus sp. KH172YL63]BCB02716.1 hypothetical protein KH172YL63_08490 [Bacillus sp. KH172YL63]